jgi:hypothetical protein
MARMTEEDADALDEFITNADITLKPGKGGIFTHQRDLLKLLDEVSANYIMTIAEANRQTPAQVIDKLVHEKIAASA